MVGPAESGHHDEFPDPDRAGAAVAGLTGQVRPGRMRVDPAPPLHDRPCSSMASATASTTDAADGFPCLRMFAAQIHK